VGGVEREISLEIPHGVYDAEDLPILWTVVQAYGKRYRGSLIRSVDKDGHIRLYTVKNGDCVFFDDKGSGCRRSVLRGDGAR